MSVHNITTSHKDRPGLPVTLVEYNKCRNLQGI